jgi:hypothetical protein
MMFIRLGAEMRLDDANVLEILNILVEPRFQCHILCTYRKTFRMLCFVANVEQKWNTLWETLADPQHGGHGQMDTFNNG